MERPTDIAIELPILLWGKTICIQMVGNDCWKHHRDYKAVLDLAHRWISLKRRPELEKIVSKMEDQFIENGDIDWDLLEKTRVIAHDYLRELDGGIHNPDPTGEGSIMVPDLWIIQRIRELTDS